MNSKGNWLATIADPLNSTVYNHSSITMYAAATKIPHLLYGKKDLLKIPKVMYDFIYSLWFIYNEYIWWEWKKNSEICTNENQGKKTLFGCPPIPRLRKWKPTVFRCPKRSKTSRTCPRWDGGPSLMGQRNIGLGTVWAVKLQWMWIIYIWTFKIFNTCGLGYGLMYKNNEDGQDL